MLDLDLHSFEEVRQSEAALLTGLNDQQEGSSYTYSGTVQI